MQCQAKCKSTQQQCRRKAVKGKRVCTVHGGLTPAGKDHPAYKHGRYSKYLPTRLREAYETSVADPELLALNAEIALADARVEDLLKRVDTGESGEAWGLARNALTKLREAMDKGEGTHVPISMLDEIIQRGLDDYAAWREVIGTAEMRRRLVETERKRRVDMQLMITAERATILISAIADIIRRNVTDPEMRRAVQRELMGLMVKEETVNVGSLPTYAPERQEVG